MTMQDCDGFAKGVCFTATDYFWGFPLWGFMLLTSDGTALGESNHRLTAVSTRSHLK